MIPKTRRITAVAIPTIIADKHFPFSSRPGILMYDVKRLRNPGFMILIVLESRTTLASPLKRNIPARVQINGGMWI